MSEKIYLHLLFFCGILCQGIFATLSDNDTGESSDLLVRKRRVINHLLSADHKMRIEDVRYLVKIRASNRGGSCAGTILSHTTVITTALCVERNVFAYQVLSGAISDNRAKYHNVTSKLTFYGNLPHQEFEGIALITVSPPFLFSLKTGNIQLHRGPLPSQAFVTVYGFGYHSLVRPGTEIRQKLRFITLPIMNHEECKAAYHGRFNITDKHICTYCVEQYCAEHDGGAPVIFNDMLVGLHVWKGDNPDERNPDVYINLQRTDYTEWIREHSRLV